MKSFASASALFAFPAAAFFAVACGAAGDAKTYEESQSTIAGRAGAENVTNESETAPIASDAAEAGAYRGPSVGAAKGFAVLAQNAVTALSLSPVTGNLGVSGASVSNITGFDAVPSLQFGIDSSAPNSMRTILTQREVEALVDDIDVRPCDADYTDLANGTTGDITLHAGVTCMNGSDAELSLSGRVILDAGGDPNAFFVVRSDFRLTVADGTALVLANGAQACGIFWRVKQQVSIGKSVQFFGTLIAGTGISMQSGSTLIGRALAQTADVVLDANTITLPVYDLNGSARACTHLQ